MVVDFAVGNVGDQLDQYDAYIEKISMYTFQWKDLKFQIQTAGLMI